MKLSKQKIAGRLAISFLLVMLFATFFAKYIRYFTSPKVVAVTVDRGRIGEDNKYYDCIIPVSALTEDRRSVYVLYKRKNFWGEEYYVKRKQVKVESQDRYKVAVSGELMFNDLVVAGWDRDIKDDVRVEVL